MPLRLCEGFLIARYAVIIFLQCFAWDFIIFNRHNKFHWVLNTKYFFSCILNIKLILKYFLDFKNYRVRNKVCLVILQLHPQLSHCRADSWTVFWDTHFCACSWVAGHGNFMWHYDTDKRLAENFLFCSRIPRTCS